MLWKFLSLGLTLARIYRKKILAKYLQLHLSYFDVTTNSPGALLTKLSIDTSQLDSLILNIVGGTVTIISTYLISLGLGILYDWKSTLILSIFVTLSVFGLLKK